MARLSRKGVLDREIPHLRIYLSLEPRACLHSLASKRDRGSIIGAKFLNMLLHLISHLLFVDDAFIFFQATTKECSRVKDLLQIYRKASEQEVNFSKTSVMFSTNIISNVKSSISDLLHVSELRGPCKYLGMPLGIWRKKSEAFGFLKDKLWARLRMW